MQRYATFWNADLILSKLLQLQEPLTTLSLEDLRKRLIICWRLLSLHRGIDLARTQRTVSIVGKKVFVLVQRKGWRFPNWEEVMVLPEAPQISPWHLMQEYVCRTAHFSGPDCSLLLSLDGSRALSSSRINSLTKEVLESFGVDTRHWKPHSTRGAGVLRWKNAALQVEEVQRLC